MHIVEPRCRYWALLISLRPTSKTHRIRLPSPNLSPLSAPWHMSYVSVPKEEHDSPDAEQLAIKTRDPSGRLCDINIVLALVAVSLCFGMGVFMFFDLAYDQMKPAETTSAPQFQVNCGSSTSEARAAGCRFDSTTFTWVPPACFGEPLMEEFLGSKNWTWSLDELEYSR